MNQGSSGMMTNLKLFWRVIVVITIDCYRAIMIQSSIYVIYPSN
jgi:hypothetical protein